MRTATQALTVIAELPPGPTPRAELEHRLAAINDDPRGNSYFAPGSLPDTHFTRFVIIDDPRGELPALLVWESNHDDPAVEYLAAVARAAPSISAIFECCADYPFSSIGAKPFTPPTLAYGSRSGDDPRGIADVDAWVAWMMARHQPAAAFYCGYRGVPRSTVINDRLVHDGIRDALDRMDRRALATLSPHEIQRRLHDALATDERLELRSIDDQERYWIAVQTIAILGLFVVLLALPVVLAIALPCYLYLRHEESRDIASAYARPVEVAPAIRALEDRVTQNQLTHLVDIKPGAFRFAILRLVLFAIDIVARAFAIRGHLGGITTIHFARWVILRDRRRKLPPGAQRRHRLLFFSNYDGSWESYLGEFIDRAAYGLTAVWSNTRGFPATEHLVCGGARAEEAFKQWTREHQIPTQLWWSWTPDATVQNIRDDIWIRRRLDRGLADYEVAEWLRRL